MAHSYFELLSTARLTLSENTDNPKLDIAKKALRYADPSSWLLAATACELLDPNLEIHRQDTGIIHIAQYGPHETMEKISDLAKRRRSSPLKFPAAAPSSSAAVACYVCRLRGPSLTLTMPWENAEPVVTSLCNTWITQSLASFVIVSREGKTPETGELFCEAQLYQARPEVLH